MNHSKIMADFLSPFFIKVVDFLLKLRVSVVLNVLAFGSPIEEGLGRSALNNPRKLEHSHYLFDMILAIRFDGTVVRGIFILNHLLSGKSSPMPCI